MDAPLESGPADRAGPGSGSVVIVGLGNPGPSYAGTRHNLGFMVADRISAALDVRTWSRPGPFDYCRGSEQGIPLHVIKPLTFMNLSGTAVREALAMTGTAPDRTLIVLDDFQLPLGTIRIRPAGSDGGHRGLASVIASLGTDAVPRLRCGIGIDPLPPAGERREFVLQNFREAEAGPAREMILRAADAARDFAARGIGHAMTMYNTQ